MKRNIRYIILAAGLISQLSACVVYGPHHYNYRAHYHRPRYENHHGAWGHPFGEHYNENKNFSR